MAVREEAKFFDMCGGHYRDSTDIDCSTEQRYDTGNNICLSCYWKEALTLQRQYIVQFTL